MRWVGLLSLCALAACNRAPNFDERYQEASNGVHASQQAMEQEMKEQISGAHDAEQAAAEVAAKNGNSGSAP
jgi:cation transport regulator ChaC